MRVPERSNNPTLHDRSTTPTAPPGPLLDMSEVAETLGVTRRHVQRLVSEKRIPYFKVGRFIRFDPAELSVWLPSSGWKCTFHPPGSNASDGKMRCSKQGGPERLESIETFESVRLTQIPPRRATSGQ
jgi:excisionase family DNA binding protein